MKALAVQYPRFGYRRIGIFLGRDGIRDEPRASLSAVAGSGFASAAQAAEEARGCEPPAATGADEAEPGVVLRLRVRPLRQWPAAQVPDRYRRVHQGGVGDRRRRPHPFTAGNRGAVALGQRARRAASPAQRQRSGVRFQGALVLDRRAGHWHRADRARQALAEWRRRELQRQIPRRMPQPRMVPHARRSKSHHRELASAL